MKPVPDDAWTWKICRAVLKMYGIDDARSGQMIGKWLKQCHGDHEMLEEIVRSAASEARGDIVSYLNGCMPKNGKTVTEEMVTEMHYKTAQLYMKTKSRLLDRHHEQAVLAMGTDAEKQFVKDQYRRV